MGRGGGSSYAAASAALSQISIPKIAAAVGLSRRYVHMLFAGSDSTEVPTPPPGSVLRFTLKLVGKGRAVCCEKILTTSVMHGRLPIIADAREEMLYQ